MLQGIIDRRTSVRISAFQVVQFIAHAWLEVDGIPIDEELDLFNYKKTICKRRTRIND